MFIGNFQDTYERLSTAKTLKTIRQKHDESLQDYVKCFCNARNVIPYIQDIEIINTFRDGISDIKTVEEIAMKKPKTVADLLTVTDTCLEESESRGKGPSKKKQDDLEVNMTDRGDCKDRRDRGYHGKQSSDQKEKRHFHCPDDAEKWCEIHRASGHDLKECKTFLDRKKMPPPAVPMPQDARRGEHHRANPPDEDEQMGEINVIFVGSMSIVSKTQDKKLEWEISLAQRIEPKRRMRWSNVDISFGSQDHPDTELFDQNLPFMVKLPIGRHKMAKTLVDSGASLNLLMRKTFIEMDLNLKDLTPVHDTFHGIILGQSSTPVSRIDLEVSYGTGDNKRNEVLTFEVASFNIGYNYILRRPFLLKFMAVIHTAYATLKMPGPKGMISIKANQRDALACENTTLTHAERFGEKAAQEQATKIAKTHGSSTSIKSLVPKPSTPPGRLQPRRAHMAPQRQTSSPLINQQI
jgi:hypothetical protein